MALTTVPEGAGRRTGDRTDRSGHLGPLMWVVVAAAIIAAAAFLLVVLDDDQGAEGDARSSTEVAPAEAGSIDRRSPDAIEHEATVSKVGDEMLFYLRSRGLTEAEATLLIVNGFIEPFTKELPMEYAVELNRLIQLEMEGSVG